MAHTFYIYNGGQDVTLDFQSAGSSATAVGYALLSYAPGVRTEQNLNNASLYTDGERTVFRRTTNVIDTIRLHVKGANADDLAIKLRAIEYALWLARDYAVMPLERDPVRLYFKPQGTTSAASKIIYGGAMQMPETYLASAVDTVEIEVTLVIEVEPYWREKSPGHSTTKTDWSTLVSSGTMANIGEVAVTAIPGDVPALTHLTVSPPSSGAAFDWVRMGYASAMRKGAHHDDAGLVELPIGGTDVSSVSDSEAQGGSVARCTFTTNQTNTLRYTVDKTDLAPGKYRALLRAKCGTAGVVLRLYYRSQFNTAVSSAAAASANTTMSEATSNYLIFDLGVIHNPPAGVGSLACEGGTLSLRLSAGGASGANLDADCLFLIPCDEYYIDAANVAAYHATGVDYGYRFDNIAPIPPYGQMVELPDGQQTTVQHAGDLQLPPGDGTLYYCITNGGASGSTYSFPYTLYRCARFLGPRGAVDGPGGINPS